MSENREMDLLEGLERLSKRVQALEDLVIPNPPRVWELSEEQRGLVVRFISDRMDNGSVPTPLYGELWDLLKHLGW